MTSSEMVPYFRATVCYDCIMRQSCDEQDLESCALYRRFKKKMEEIKNNRRKNK